MAPPFSYAYGDFKSSDHTVASLSPSLMDPPTPPEISSNRDFQSNSNFSSNNERLRYCRPSVHFPLDFSLVAIVHTHPRIPVHDKPAIHYSGDVIKRSTYSFRYNHRKYWDMYSNLSESGRNNRAYSDSWYIFRTKQLEIYVVSLKYNHQLNIKGARKWKGE